MRKALVMILATILTLLVIATPSSYKSSNIRGEELKAEDEKNIENLDLDLSEIDLEGIVSSAIEDSHEEGIGLDLDDSNNIVNKILDNEIIFSTQEVSPEPEKTEPVEKNRFQKDAELADKIVNSAMKSSKNANNVVQIPYTEGEYLGTNSENEIIVDINGDTKIVKLIGIRNGSLEESSLQAIMQGSSRVYLEYDVKKTAGDIDLAYVWLDIPSSDNKEAMVNVMLIQGGLATFENQVPNIKYTWYFLKF